MFTPVIQRPTLSFQGVSFRRPPVSERGQVQLDLDVTGNDRVAYSDLFPANMPNLSIRVAPRAQGIDYQTTADGTPLSLSSSNRPGPRKAAFSLGSRWFYPTTADQYRQLSKLMDGVVYESTPPISLQPLMDGVMLDLIGQYAQKLKRPDPAAKLEDMKANTGVESVEYLPHGVDSFLLKLQVSPQALQQYPKVLGQKGDVAYLKFELKNQMPFVDYYGTHSTDWCVPTTPEQYFELWHLIRNLPESGHSEQPEKNQLMRYLFNQMLHHYQPDFYGVMARVRTKQ